MPKPAYIPYVKVDLNELFPPWLKKEIDDFAYKKEVEKKKRIMKLIEEQNERRRI